MKNENGGCLGVWVKIMIRYTLGILGAILVFYGINYGEDIIYQNHDIQKEATISLNAIIDEGESFPEGEYVGFEARWVMGPFASNMETNSLKFDSGSSAAEVSNTVEYYYVVLEDGTLMSIATRNKQEIQKLDEMTEWFIDVDGFPLDGETLSLRGKLTAMDDRELKGYYNEYLEYFGLSKNSKQVRYLTLDTSAGREWVFEMLTYVGIAIAALFAIWLVVTIIRQSKKSKEEAKFRRVKGAGAQDVNFSSAFGDDENK